MRIILWCTSLKTIIKILKHNIIQYTERVLFIVIKIYPVNVFVNRKRCRETYLLIIYLECN